MQKVRPVVLTHDEFENQDVYLLLVQDFLAFLAYHASDAEKNFVDFSLKKPTQVDGCQLKTF